MGKNRRNNIPIPPSVLIDFCILRFNLKRRTEVDFARYRRKAPFFEYCKLKIKKFCQNAFCGYMFFEVELDSPCQIKAKDVKIYENRRRDGHIFPPGLLHSINLRCRSWVITFLLIYILYESWFVWICMTLGGQSQYVNVFLTVWNSQTIYHHKLSNQGWGAMEITSKSIPVEIYGYRKSLSDTIVRIGLRFKQLYSKVRLIITFKI